MKYINNDESIVALDYVRAIIKSNNLTSFEKPYGILFIKDKDTDYSGWNYEMEAERDFIFGMIQNKIGSVAIDENTLISVEPESFEEEEGNEL